MEERKMKASFAKSGSGSLNSRVIIPITWFRKIGVTPEEREIKIKINEEKGQIIIEKDN